MKKIEGASKNGSGGKGGKPSGKKSGKGSRTDKIKRAAKELLR